MSSCLIVNIHDSSPPWHRDDAALRAALVVSTKGPPRYVNTMLQRRASGSRAFTGTPAIAHITSRVRVRRARADPSDRLSMAAVFIGRLCQWQSASCRAHGDRVLDSQKGEYSIRLAYAT